MWWKGIQGTKLQGFSSSYNTDHQVIASHHSLWMFLNSHFTHSTSISSPKQNRPSTREPLARREPRTQRRCPQTAQHAPCQRPGGRRASWTGKRTRRRSHPCPGHETGRTPGPAGRQAGSGHRLNTACRGGPGNRGHHEMQPTGGLGPGQHIPVGSAPVP